MNILLLVSAFNGLSQRAWCALRGAGHDVTVELAPVYDTPEALTAMVYAADPDLILCPFLKHRVPAEVWQKWPTVIIHPGPVGDRGPSSLDYAIMEGDRQWGVTALSAVEEMDAGPVWATRTFAVPERITKAALYNGPVADAAMECIAEVVAGAADPRFSPTPQEQLPRPVPHATTRPALRRADRAIDWSWPADRIARVIRAADSSPGVRVTIGDATVNVYDACIGDPSPRRFTPGRLVARGEGAVAVATGDRLLWIGHAKVPRDLGGNGVKLPAATVLADESTPQMAVPRDMRLTRYERIGDVGVLTVHAYNGAMSTEQCDRIAVALTAALDDSTGVVVLRGTSAGFSNGIHLNVIDTAPDPAAEAWANIVAINRLCTALVSCTDKLTVAAFTANAGAGGVMLGLAADVVVARDGVVLNPYYDMGLYGSELHSYTLPRRVGPATAARLLDARLPVDAAEAAVIGLVDAVGPGDPGEFDGWLTDLAQRYADDDWHQDALAAKAGDLARLHPPAYYEARELAEMARDFFDDRSGFAAARAEFVHKTPPTATPAKLARHRWSLAGR